MLTTSTVAIANELANEFTARGLYINPEPDTPLQKLHDCLTAVKVVTPVNGAIVNNQNHFTPNSLVTVASDYNSHMAGEAVEHEEIMDQIVDLVSSSVENHLAFARNTVKPLVIDAIEQVQEKFNSLTADPYQGWKIIKIKMPQALTDSSLVEAIEEYKVKYEVTAKEASFDLFPKLSYDQIHDLVINNSGSAEDISILLATYEENHIVGMFESIFSGSQHGDDHVGADPGKALLVYLACNRLIDEVPEGSKGSLASYATAVAAVRARMANIISSSVTTYNAHMDQQLLLKSFNTFNNTCEVFEETYEKFKENEANHDGLIFASTLLKRPARYLSEFQERFDELSSNWRSFELMIATTFKNRMHNNYREIYIDIAQEVASKNLDVVLSNYEGAASDAAKLSAFADIKKRIVETTESFTSTELEDVASCCEKLIAGVCFSYTGAYDIIVNMKKAFETNPDLNASEAALISSIDYICQYVFDQMVVQG